MFELGLDVVPLSDRATLYRPRRYKNRLYRKAEQVYLTPIAISPFFNSTLRHHIFYSNILRHHVCNRFTTILFFFIFLRCRIESNNRSKFERKHIASFLLSRTVGWHSDGIDLFCMEVIEHIGISFFVDKFVSHFALLQLYSDHLVISETPRSNQMVAAILNPLVLSNQEDGYLKKNVQPHVDCQMVTVPYFFLNFNKYFVDFLQNQRSNITFHCNSVFQVLREMLKPGLTASVFNISRRTWQTLTHKKHI